MTYPNTNMDIHGPSIADGPQLEFTLLLNELEDMFVVGTTGEVIIPVEVIQVNKEAVSFRKRGRARVQGKFGEITLEQLENELPVAE